MRRFRLIEHTADIGLEAYGSNLAEAFANAGYGLFSIITDLRKVRQVETHNIEVSADDVEGLLFAWLNHLIYVFDVNTLLLKKFEISGMTDNRLKAVCSGEKYDPSRHELKIGVKAATYHTLTVDREKNQVRVIFDI